MQCSNIITSHTVALSVLVGPYLTCLQATYESQQEDSTQVVKISGNQPTLSGNVALTQMLLPRLSMRFDHFKIFTWLARLLRERRPLSSQWPASMLISCLSMQLAVALHQRHHINPQSSLQIIPQQTRNGNDPATNKNCKKLTKKPQTFMTMH